MAPETVADRLEVFPVHIEVGEAVGEGFAGIETVTVTLPHPEDQQPVVTLYDLA